MTRNFWATLVFSTIPVGAGLVVALRKTEGSALNQLLGKTARLLLLFSILLAGGIFLSVIGN
jgi:hypothetical protein